MMHIAIFPTWSCQLSCDYCSIRNSKIDRTVKPVGWGKWADALQVYLKPGDIVDIAGGEPLNYVGLLSLVHSLAKHGLRWALTTNAISRYDLNLLCKCKLPGCVCINVSDHQGNPGAGANIDRLRAAGYAVNVHRVDHPAAGHRLDDAQIITYQDWAGGKATDGIKRWCTAGKNHWVAGPNGDMWRCIVAMQTGQPSTGNLFTGEVRPTSPECDFGCTTCYTEDPASWCVEMRAL